MFIIFLSCIKGTGEKKHRRNFNYFDFFETKIIGNKLLLNKFNLIDV